MRRVVTSFPGLLRRPSFWFPISASLIGSTLWSLFPGPAGFLFLIMSCLVILGYLITMFALIGASIVRGQWHAGARRVALVAIAVPISILGIRSGDYLHVVVAYPYYRLKIAQTAERPVRFPWGDQAVTVADGLQFRALLYDDRGEMNLIDHRVGDGNGVFWVSTRRLMGQFFIQEVISCQNAARCIGR